MGGLSLGLGLGLTRVSGPRPYWGIVGTRGIFTASTINTTFKQAQLRTFHYARDNISSLKLLFSDFRTTSETAVGSDTTITASVEYPIGVTRTQVTFSGSDTGTLESGSELLSDAISVSIPKDAKYYIHQLRENATGYVYDANTVRNAAGGDLCRLAASGLTDLTMAGTITNNASNIVAPATIALTRKPTFLLIGDSKIVGTSDVSGGSANGDQGEFARSIGPLYGYANAGQTGDRASLFNSAHARRMALAAYVSHVLCNHGINEISAGNSAATVEAAFQTMWSTLAASGARKVYHATIAPRSTSTDSYATTVNQTTHAANAVRTTVNDWLRGTPSGIQAYIELADAVESARNSGLWTPTYTSDGIHENQAGNEAIVTANIMPTFIYP